MTVAEAEQARDAARAQVMTTLATVQERLDPRAVARGAARDVTGAAATGLETVRRNPGAIAGLTAVAGLFLARRRITGLFRRDAGDGHV